MKFIFPQNYDFKLKLFGFIDYSTAVLNIVIDVIVYFFINIFIHSVYLKIICLISISFPILLLSIVGFNHENIIYVVLYIYKFTKNRAIYLYKKE